MIPKGRLILHSTHNFLFRSLTFFIQNGRLVKTPNIDVVAILEGAALQNVGQTFFSTERYNKRTYFQSIPNFSLTPTGRGTECHLLHIPLLLPRLPNKNMTIRHSIRIQKQLCVIRQFYIHQQN